MSYVRCLVVLSHAEVPPFIPLVFPYGLRLSVSDLAVPSQAGYAADGRIPFFFTAEQYSILCIHIYTSWASLPIYPLTDNIEMISKRFHVLRHPSAYPALTGPATPSAPKSHRIGRGGVEAPSLSLHAEIREQDLTMRVRNQSWDNGILAGRRGRSPSAPSSGRTPHGLSLHVSGL